MSDSANITLHYKVGMIGKTRRIDKLGYQRVGIKFREVVVKMTGL